MPRCRALRWKYPTLLSCIAPGPQNFEDSPAHRNESSPFCGLAVWDKDYAVLPVQILDKHPEESSFVPHSRVAHQDDDVTERSRVLGRQLQAKPPIVSFFSTSSLRRRCRPCSFIILIFGAWPSTFHSSALCSIRRGVLKAQLAFAAEPGNFNCSAKSPMIWSTRKPATDVALSRRSHCDRTSWVSPPTCHPQPGCQIAQQTQKRH